MSLFSHRSDPVFRSIQWIKSVKDEGSDREICRQRVKMGTEPDCPSPGFLATGDSFTEQKPGQAQ